MKKKGIFCFLFSAFFLVGSLSVSAAEISFYKGKVNVLRQNKNVKVKRGFELKNGDTIKTGKKSFAEVSYRDGTKIRVYQKSIVKVSESNFSGSDLIIVVGKINGKFSKVKKGKKKHNIYTPTTVAAVRGTEFDVTVADNGNSRVDMKEGKLEVRNPEGNINIKNKEKAVIEMTEEPKKKWFFGDSKKWLDQNNSKLEKKPADFAESYKEYLNSLDEDSSDAAEEIEELNSKVRSSSTTKSFASEIENSVEKYKDEYCLTMATQESIKNLIQSKMNITKDPSFLKLNEKAKAVALQKERNYLEIQKVYKRYQEEKAKIKKQYDDQKKNINSTFEKEKEKIKNRTKIIK